MRIFWPKAATKVTGIIFLVQLLTEMVGNRKPGFEWVLPACGALFAAALAWTLYAVVVNASRARVEDSK